MLTRCYLLAFLPPPPALVYQRRTSSPGPGLRLHTWNPPSARRSLIVRDGIYADCRRLFGKCKHGAVVSTRGSFPDN